MFAKLSNYSYFYFQLAKIFALSLFGIFSVNSVKAENIDLDNRPLNSPFEELPSPNSDKPIKPKDLLPSPEQLLPSTNQPSELEIPLQEAEKITVKKFQFVGNTVFSTAQLEAITQSFVGKEISFAELMQARSAITKLYVDAGYITSGAYIPPQKLGEGTVTIEIVEGHLETINVTGEGRLKPDYVRERLKNASEPVLNVPRLLQALQVLQLNPLIEKVSAELSSGTRPGLSVLDINFKQAKTFNVQVTLDNGRSPSVGSFKRQVELSEANLFGFGDGFNFTYTNTDGSNVFDTNYTIPFNTSNGTLKLAYSTRSSGVIEPPFDDIDGDGSADDIKSESRSYEITLRQPLYQSANYEFAIGLTADRWEGETSLLNVPFPLSAGADDKGRSRINSLRFFQEWTNRNEQQILALRSQFNFGLDAFDATTNNDGPDGRYFSWRGQAQWVKMLAPATLFIVRGDLQLSDRPLLTQEQFGSGGKDSTRGYRQDILLTDNGFFGSMELRLPLYAQSKSDTAIHLIPFVDFSTGWNNDSVEPDPSTLVSLGLGLQWKQSDRFTARIDWGIPLISVESQKRTLQEDGLYFSLIYNLF